jgi:hypothetical protein
MPTRSIFVSTRGSEATGNGLACVLQIPVVFSEELRFGFLDQSNGIGLHLAFTSSSQ